MADIAKLIDRPGGYLLSENARITRKGLWTHEDAILHLFGFGFGDVEYDVDLGYCIPHPSAAKVLRYQKGRPYCVDDTIGVLTLTEDFESSGDRLNDVANIIVRGSAQSFRVLHWCIAELGGNQ